MKKGKKNIGGKKKATAVKKKATAVKKKATAGKKAVKGKKKPVKGKKPTVKGKPEFQKKLEEQMMKRINKKPRPMKVLQEKYKELMERYDKIGKHRPVYSIGKKNKGNLNTSVPPIELSEVLANTPESEEIDEIFIERRTTMVEKRKGDEDDSPINIDTGIVKKCNYPRLAFEGLFDPERKTNIRNSGYHVIGNLGGEVLISSGPLFGSYKLANFHVHYGEAHNDGTEHAINGRKFTLELHMVFLPHEIVVIEESFKMVPKKAVLGLMFKLSNKPSYYDLFSLVTHINEKGKSLETSNNLLYDFKDVLSGSEYFNYSGSATEGDHSEYEWILFKKVLPINRTQMQNMWDLRMFTEKKSNVKPTQLLGERPIFSPKYLDHKKCQGKQQCECYGNLFKPKQGVKIKV